MWLTLHSSDIQSIHPKIKFTIEIENQNKIPFLDILLIRNDGNSIITKWYKNQLVQCELSIMSPITISHIKDLQ